jgi:signal transduction histidine kinase
MTIRTRLSLWYSVVLGGIALSAIALTSYHELVVEKPERQESSQNEVKLGDEDIEEIEALTWIVVPAVILGAVGGWWLTRRALAPVTALTRAAEKIQENTLGGALPRSGNGDELDRLTEVFNAMTARLNDSFERIREFTLHASHELKTPLTVLCGETESILRDESIPAGERERAGSQLEEFRRLTRIVDGLTLLAKADAGQVTLNLETIRFDALVNDCFADAQILAEPLGIRVELPLCEKISLRGDRHRLRQLLLNLADNAVKYNHRQGLVTMSLRQVNGLAEFTIANTGAGIPPEILPRIFDRFFRGDPAHASTVEGCGLGLSIAQWIVSAHNGTIHVASEVSQHTTVTVRLPA